MSKTNKIIDVDDITFIEKYINKNYKELFNIDISTWVDSLIDETEINTTNQALERITTVVTIGKERITSDLSTKLSFPKDKVKVVVDGYFISIEEEINKIIKSYEDN